jgi:hypothetical protein
VQQLERLLSKKLVQLVTKVKAGKTNSIATILRRHIGNATHITVPEMVSVVVDGQCLVVGFVTATEESRIATSANGLPEENTQARLFLGPKV